MDGWMMGPCAGGWVGAGVSSWRELVPDEELQQQGPDGAALFLTASSSSSSGPTSDDAVVVLGAKVQPMDALTFPFLVQFFPDNILGGNPRAWQNCKEQVGRSVGR